MPSIPPDQASPYPHNRPPDRPHLTIRELAERWRRTPKTIERHYQEWGLIPLRFGGRLIFPIEQVLEAERRIMEHAVAGQPIGRPMADADLAELKQEMMAAHPDRGGSEAAFIKARNRFVQARAQRDAAQKRARTQARSKRRAPR